jgi:hypothetical protein
MQDRLHRPFVVDHREGDDRDVRGRVREVPDRIDAVAPRHVQVHEHDVGCQRGGCGDGLDAV